MSWPFPYLWTVVSLTTSPVIGTSIVDTLLGAPAANGNYRIIGLNISLTRTATGILNMTFQGSLGSGVFYRALGAQVPSFDNHPVWFPEPGIQLTDQEALQVSHNASVASQNFFVTVYYYSEVNNI